MKQKVKSGKGQIKPKHYDEKGTPKPAAWDDGQLKLAIDRIARFDGETKLFELMKDEERMQELGLKPIQDGWLCFRSRIRRLDKESLSVARKAYLKQLEDIPIFHSAERLKRLQAICDAEHTPAKERIMALSVALKEATKDAEIRALAESGGKTQVNVVVNTPAEVVQEAAVVVPDLFDEAVLDELPMERLLTLYSLIKERIPEGMMP